LSDTLHPDQSCIGSVFELMNGKGGFATMFEEIAKGEGNLTLCIAVCMFQFIRSGAGERYDLVVAHQKDLMRSSVTNWLNMCTNYRIRYLDVETVHVRAKLHKSILLRNAKFDIIVQTIDALPEQKGHATAFMLDLLAIAASLNPPRGVQLQQVITVGSKRLANKLCTMYNWHWSDDRSSVFSP
jgi:hypothetical protein